MYFTDRGVRPMSRAGAYVAGADDLHATWYNPAGLADAGQTVLFDMAWLRFEPQYTRELRIVDSGGTVRHVTDPTIRGSSQIIPIPTFLFSWHFDDKGEWTGAAGFSSPYIALASYPETLDNGQPSPARYTLGSFNGSLLAIPGYWMAWKPTKELRIGAGVQALVGIFQSTITFTVSPQDRLLGAPEQPELDAAGQIRVGPIFAPTANGGIIYEPHPAIRFGLSGQLPMIISSSATIKVRLPSDVALDGASIIGDQAHVKFELPGIVRAGVELRAVENLRVELAYVHEFWSSHDTITATPDGIYLANIKGAPPRVAMPQIVIPRNFQDTNSVRIGGEYAIHFDDYVFDVRAGLSWESSAVPPPYLSLSSLDFPKYMAAFGGGLHIGRWRFDGVYAHTFAKTTYVSSEDAQIPRINPLKGNAPLEPVNGGTYSASADLIGVGLQYAW